MSYSVVVFCAIDASSAAFRACSTAISALSASFARSRAFAWTVIPVNAAAQTTPSANTAVATTGRMLRGRRVHVVRDRVCFFTHASCASDRIKWKRRDLETGHPSGATSDQTQDVDRCERLAS